MKTPGDVNYKISPQNRQELKQLVVYWWSYSLVDLTDGTVVGQVEPRGTVGQGFHSVSRKAAREGLC